MTELTSLQNHFLIAMPSLEDAYFSRSITYICEHNSEGAMGIVINQPSTMSLKELLEQTDKDVSFGDDTAEPNSLGGRTGWTRTRLCPALWRRRVGFKLVTGARDHGYHL